MIRIHATVKDDATPVLRRMRRDIRARTAKAMRAIGERIVLPEARRRGNRWLGPFSSALVVRTRATSAFLTGSSLKKGRVIGLHEFGGVIATPIRPRRAEAIRTPYGPRAVVRKPRRYKGRRFLVGAVHDTYPEYERTLLQELMSLFDPFEHTP